MKREKMQTARTKSGFIKHLRNNWMLYAMLLPVLLWYAIFWLSAHGWDQPGIQKLSV